MELKIISVWLKCRLNACRNGFRIQWMLHWCTGKLNKCLAWLIWAFGLYRYSVFVLPSKSRGTKARPWAEYFSWARARARSHTGRVGLDFGRIPSLERVKMIDGRETISKVKTSSSVFASLSLSLSLSHTHTLTLTHSSIVIVTRHLAKPVDNVSWQN